MTFIPENNELLSDWLDREARELFRGEYPREITDSDIDEFLKKHPVRHRKPAKWKLRPTRADAALIRSVNRSLGVMVDAPTAFGDPTLDAPLIRKGDGDPTLDAPLVRKGVAAFQVEIDKLLRDRRAVARHVLESQRVDLIKKLKWRAFEHHRQRFYSGSLKSLVVRADGSKLEIERSVWGSDYATGLVADCSFEGRPILVPLAPAAKASFRVIEALLKFFERHAHFDDFQGMTKETWYLKAQEHLGVDTFTKVDFNAAWRQAVQLEIITRLKGAPKKAKLTKQLISLGGTTEKR